VAKLSNVPIYLGYSVSLAASVLGIVLVTGFAFQYIPLQMRVMMGVVFILLGIYRLVLTRTKARQQSKDEEE
jgi:cadmium resistance protein CadD (predicted permease)